MFEDKTYDVLLKGMLDRVDSSLDKREGSIIYDALAPAAAELAMAYIELEVVLRESFASTASREYLVLRAGERGLTPNAATYAVGIGEFNIDVGEGARFSLDSYNWVTVESIEYEDGIDGYYYYTMQCETAGSEPNGSAGNLSPITTITGLKHAVLLEVTTDGEDEEDTEAFRERYMESVSTQSFGGNVAQYKELVKAYSSAVGGVKVYRADDWNGGGTVGIYVQGSDYGAVTDEDFLEELQTYIDPTSNSGEGIGMAPIGHQVSVMSCGETEINVTADFTMQDGCTFDGYKDTIESTIKAYFDEVNQGWEDAEDESEWAVTAYSIVVCLGSIAQIKNVENLKVNGENSVLIGLSNVAVLGTVEENESE